MNAYERILGTMRREGQKDNTAPIQIGTMTGTKSCRVGKLPLDEDDLLIAEHLLTGYHKAVDGTEPSKKNDDTYVKPLQEGDQVAVYRASDEQYIILERLV